MKLKLSLLSFLVVSLLSTNINSYEIKAYEDELKNIENDIAKLKIQSGTKALAAMSLLSSSAAELSKEISDMQKAAADYTAKKAAVYKNAAINAAKQMKEDAEKVAEQVKSKIAREIALQTKADAEKMAEEAGTYSIS